MSSTTTRKSSYCHTKWGAAILEWSDQTIFRLEFVDLGPYPYPASFKSDPQGQKVCNALLKGQPGYFLAPKGTAFQKAVWQALLSIPHGELRSYQEIAQAIGRPQSVRAVANAIGANPICVLIPCHRVIRSDGSIGGYSSGLAIKRQLLVREGHTQFAEPV